MSSDARCPACSARLGPDAPWCTQCWAPVAAAGRDAPDTAEAPAAAEAAEAVEAVEAVEARETAAPPQAPVVPAPAVPAPRAGEAPAPAWPCRSCETANPLHLPACTACRTPFLALERPSLVLPVVGDLVEVPRAQRLAAAVALVLLVVGGLAALLALG